ncbi:MAG: hypothetical protein RR857_20030 [Comamonas sp.]
MSDTLILGNAVLPSAASPADAPAPGWSELAPGVRWQGNVADYEDAVTIDIVGVADLHALGANFLLLP